MFSAVGGLSMRGIGRVVAAVLLAGGVAGAAAFAHLLNVPGSTVFSAPSALPSSTGAGAPLVIRANLLPSTPRPPAAATHAPPWLVSRSAGTPAPRTAVA